MLKQNKEITISGKNALEALKEIEFMLVSLRKMGTYYIGKPQNEYQDATTKFIDNFGITGRLAKVRRLICEGFDTTLGEDDMDDLERHMQDLEFWKPTDETLNK
ncbi:hypothetical protein M2399_002554 [Pseudomonas sp. BIGb0450]|jgi:hypothetical protein|uniref:hypothetical protein n=1 Tax=Pseudomonas TaxID=286 RepID=UPI0015A29E02|nr:MULTISPECIES: hypothetical protein [Pseudomonas]MCS3417176.1 hypothetical protein [Pseudomonas sp. BIGb0558]MCS3437117.1 hypothetical protein [Pseudomonas sp. BIGb0450]NWD25631.1 hypothetical protein [Pseudomonas yamanorum]